MTDTIEPSSLIHQDYVHSVTNDAKRRHSSSSASTNSSLEDDNTFSTMHSRRSSLDSESSTESVKPSYMHRRQMEEAILEKITHQLDADKLPGILTIISHNQDNVEEVEIDLAKLDYVQLEHILLYVDACLLEKQGGPKVKLNDYVIQPMKKSMPKQRRRKQRCTSIVEAGHVVHGTCTSRLSDSYGPMSMSALTEYTVKRKNNKKRTPKKNKKFNHTLPVKKPSKRKTALHKRKLLEDMIQPSSNDEDEEENSKGDIIIFGNEQMDFAVTDNQTIVHSSLPTQHIPSVNDQPIEADEDDELIDIMM
ncbi:uncharacterized protein B0P05DRAFT_528436 [Gilbertella persicaria]|uniref:uncharacterized protein n=1 Tax=Gilbertella persicaria TaxID=101096 RepID=UPI00221E6C57|nr:uncharacterized protein B0P05DRAFT_528436 [Gilbertella persicaria]KAI8091024.1 hypothetical protein B0P05DRAFT_528436 [Gilbertella persicaria]